MNPLTQIGYPRENKLASFKKEEPINTRYFRVSSSKKKSTHLSSKELVWDDHVKKIRELIEIPHESLATTLSNPTQFLEINHHNFQNIYDYFSDSGKHYLVATPLVGYLPLTDFLHQAQDSHASAVKLETLQNYAKLLKYLDEHIRCAAGHLNLENVYLRKSATKTYHILFSAKSFFPSPAAIYSITAPECLETYSKAIPQSDIHIFGQLSLLFQSDYFEEQNPNNSWDFDSQFKKLRHKLSPRWQNIISDCTTENPLERPICISSIIDRAFQKKHSYKADLFQESTGESHDKLQYKLEKSKKKLALQENQLLTLNDEIIRHQTEKADTKKIISNLENKVTHLSAERDELKSDNQAILNQGESGLEERFTLLKTRSETLQQELKKSTDQHELLQTKFDLIKSECDELRDLKFQNESETELKESKEKELTTKNHELEQEISKLRLLDRPLSTPILITLLVSCLAGASLGFIWKSKTHKSENSPNITRIDIATDLPRIPTKINKLSPLITTKNILHFFNSSGASPQHHKTLCASLASENGGEIAAGCNYFVASNFCNWLTQKALTQEQIKAGYFYRLPTVEELNPVSDSASKVALWTQDNHTDNDGITIGHKITEPKGLKSWLPPFMQKSFKGQLMGFRVILDIAKP